MILPPVAPTSGASPYGAGWPQPGQLEPVTGFGSGGWKPPATFVPTAAPVAWLFGAVGAGAVALAAGLLAMYLKLPWLAIAAWAIGGPATIALTTVFTSVDTSRRTQIGYGQDATCSPGCCTGVRSPSGSRASSWPRSTWRSGPGAGSEPVMTGSVRGHLRATRRIGAAAVAFALLLGGLVLGSTTSAVAAGGDDDSAPTSPIERLGACLAGGGAGDILLLVDKSGSLRDTDPNGARVTAAQYFINQLAGYQAESGADISVAISTFGEYYTPFLGWTPLGASSVGGIQNSIGSLKGENDGQDTDYWLALQGSAATLAKQRADHAVGKASCQAIVWFSDGELDIDARRLNDDRKPYAPDLVLGGPEAGLQAEQIAETDICRDGGIADQIRSAGIITFGVGLDAGAPVDFGLMTRIVTGSDGGTNCGAILDPVPGQFFRASDIDGMLLAFDALGNPGNAPVTQEHGICQEGDGVCEGHRVVTDLSTPRLTILAFTPIPVGNVVASVRSPSGESVTLSPGAQTVEIDGATVAYTWETDRTVQIEIDQGKADDAAWVGVWELTFTDSTAASAGQVSVTNIRVFGDVTPSWSNQSEVEFFAGEKPVGLQFELISRRSGEPIDLEAIADTKLDFSAVLRDSKGVAISSGPIENSTKLIDPIPFDLKRAAIGPGTLTIRMQITTADATLPGTDEVVPGTQLMPRRSRSRSRCCRRPRTRRSQAASTSGRPRRTVSRSPACSRSPATAASGSRTDPHPWPPARPT